MCTCWAADRWPGLRANAARECDAPLRNQKANIKRQKDLTYLLPFDICLLPFDFSSILSSRMASQKIPLNLPAAVRK